MSQHSLVNISCKTNTQLSLAAVLLLTTVVRMIVDQQCVIVAPSRKNVEKCSFRRRHVH